VTAVQISRTSRRTLHRRESPPRLSQSLAPGHAGFWK
jgi:hypothetical protein